MKKSPCVIYNIFDFHLTVKVQIKLSHSQGPTKGNENRIIISYFFSFVYNPLFLIIYVGFFY